MGCKVTPVLHSEWVFSLEGDVSSPSADGDRAPLIHQCQCHHRVVEVQDEAEQQGVTAFQLKPQGGQPPHETHELPHREHEPGPTHVPGGGQRRLMSLVHTYTHARR